jgi:hypothetical protein
MSPERTRLRRFSLEHLAPNRHRLSNRRCGSTDPETGRCGFQKGSAPWRLGTLWVKEVPSRLNRSMTRILFDKSFCCWPRTRHGPEKSLSNLQPALLGPGRLRLGEHAERHSLKRVPLTIYASITAQREINLRLERPAKARKPPKTARKNQMIAFRGLSNQLLNVRPLRLKKRCTRKLMTTGEYE